MGACFWGLFGVSCCVLVFADEVREAALSALRALGLACGPRGPAVLGACLCLLGCFCLLVLCSGLSVFCCVLLFIQEFGALLLVYSSKPHQPIGGGGWLFPMESSAALFVW